MFASCHEHSSEDGDSRQLAKALQEEREGEQGEERGGEREGLKIKRGYLLKRQQKLLCAFQHCQVSFLQIRKGLVLMIRRE